VQLQLAIDTAYADGVCTLMIYSSGTSSCMKRKEGALVHSSGTSSCMKRKDHTCRI